MGTEERKQKVSQCLGPGGMCNSEQGWGRETGELMGPVRSRKEDGKAKWSLKEVLSRGVIEVVLSLHRTVWLLSGGQNKGETGGGHPFESGDKRRR